MASFEYDGGIGGKFRRRPFRRAPATPYDRPPTAVRRANPNPNAIGATHGWISRIVDPASRIIARGASRFFSSVFQKRLTAPPAQSLPSGENLLSEHRAPEPVCNDLQTHKPSNIAPESIHAVGNVTKLYDTGRTQQKIVPDGLFELEQLLKQKTFTREEFDRLTDLLRSRTVEPIVPKQTADSSNKESAIVIKQLQQHGQTAIEPHASQTVVSDERKGKTIVSEQEDRLGSSGLHGNIIDPPVNLHIAKEEAISPAEIVKVYMGSNPSDVSPSTLSLQSWMSQEDTTSLTESYGNKPPTPFTASRCPVDNSRIVEYSEHVYTTPRPRGRSALYKMSRSPYFKVQQASTVKAGKALRDGLGSSSMSLVSQRSIFSDGKQGLKRGSSVLDDNIGSFGPIRRIRQKSDLKSPASERHSFHGNLPSSIVTSLDQHVHQRSASSNQRTVAAVIPVPPQSTEMARRIFQELDKLVASPRENMSETTVIKGNVDLDALRDSPSPSLRDSISPKQGKITDSGLARHGVSAVKVTDEAIGVNSPVSPSTDVHRKIIDASSSDLAAISSQQPSSQRRASEGSQELGSSKYRVGSASEPFTTGRDKMLGTSLAIPVEKLSFSHSACKGEADAKVSVGHGPEEAVAAVVSPVPTFGFKPSRTFSISPQLVDGSVVKKEISSLASESASKGLLATTANCRPATLEVGVSAAPTAGMIGSSGLDKEDMTCKAGESEKLFGDGSGSSTLVSPRKSNGSPNSSSSFLASAAPTEAYLRNMGPMDNSRNLSVRSAAVSIPSSNPSFQFGSTARDTADAGDSNRNSMKISPVSVSSSVAPRTSNSFSSMQITSSTPPASFMFSSINDNASAQAASSLSISTVSCSSSVPALASVSSHMNSISGLGTSGIPSTSNLSFTGNNFPNPGSHFGVTTGSIFGVQPAPSGSGTASLPDSSAVQCGPSSGSISGLNASSSGWSGDSGFVFTTPGTKSSGLQMGFSFTASSPSSNSITSFAPTTTSNVGLSNSQPPSSSMLTSTLGSNPSLPSSGFSFGQQMAPSGNLPSFVGASQAPVFSFSSASTSVSSWPVFSFSSIGASTSSATPSPTQSLFSMPTRSAGFGSSSPGNDQMNIEDSMVDDSVPVGASSVPTFGQQVTSLSTPNFQAGMSSSSIGGPSVFQFGSIHSSTGLQNPSPFQPGGSFELSTGGSFSLGSGGGDKSGRRIVKVKRDKHRKK